VYTADIHARFGAIDKRPQSSITARREPSPPT
jgi:hypothetical protein